MPILRNARHERFAQELAKGKTQDEAYQTAGYKPDAPNACRLSKKDKVRTRIDELLGKVAERSEKAAANAEVKCIMTIESLIGEANELLQEARELKQISAGVAALTAKAKLGGLWIERQEAKVDQTSHVIERRPTADEWEKEHSEASGSVAPAARPAARPH